MTDGLLTPQQELFLASYTNPKSETFGNARQSALKAQYSETYADNITDAMPEWLLENIGDLIRLRKAEKILDRTMDMEPIDELGRVDNGLIANQLKAASLVAKGIGKAKYSERVEQTGKDGAPLVVQMINFDDYNTPQSQTEQGSR